MMQKFYSLFQESYIQTFDDEKKGRGELVSLFPASELPAKKQWLIENNKRGMGVFFTPNPCKDGRGEGNVTAIRWVYADLDDSTEQQMWQAVDIKNAPIPPDIIVRSGRGFHLYWRVDCTKEQFKKLIGGLIFHFNADPAISSTNEVLRLPGFMHVKDITKPKKVEILQMREPLEVWHIDDMLEAYPEPAKQIQKSFVLQNDEMGIIKTLPIKSVLGWLGVDVRRNQIFKDGKGTSAMINEGGNYINRFSGQAGSGSTIDAVMVYGNMDLKSAIGWLKDRAGIKNQTPAQIAKEILEAPLTPKKYHKYYTWGTKELTDNFAPIKRDTYAIVGAGYGVGKTTFCMNLAIKNAELGHKVLYLSLEMDNEELFDYLSRKYAGWTIPEEIYKQVPESKLEAYNKHRKYLGSMENFTLRGVKAGADVTWEVLVELMKGDWDMIIVDNFNLVARGDKVSQYDHENALSKNFLRYTASRQVPIIVVHHYSQGGAKENIKTGYSLSGSARIKNDAMRIVLLDRKRPSDDEDAAPLSAKEKAAMKVVLDKGRAYDNWISKVIYFQRGAFDDVFQEAFTF